MKKIFNLVVGLSVILALGIGVPEGYFESLIAHSSTNPRVLYDVDIATGMATSRTNISTGERASFAGLASLGCSYYAADIGPPYWSFGMIDSTTGVFTMINDQGGSTDWQGLAGAKAVGLLYSIDISSTPRPLVAVTPGNVITVINTDTGIEG
jgi:hypothetical protein